MTGDFFNQDGHLDFATANETGQQVVVRLGTGIRQTFQAAVSSVGLGFPGPRDVVAADFNADGHLDLATANNTRLSLLLGNGTGQYPTVTQVPGVALALKLAAGDVNGDGLPDLVATGNAGGGNPGDTVFVCINNGAAGFFPPLELALPPGSLPNDVELEDPNGDGRLDILVANLGNGGAVAIFPGDGLGGFGPVDLVSTVAGARAVTVADFDGSGTVDLFVPTTTDRVTSLENSSPRDGFITPAGDFSTLTQNPDGTFTRRLKDGTQIHFDAQGRQTSVVDRNGNTTTYTYDGTSDRVLTITDPVGLVTTFAYGPDDKLETITDPAGRVTLFEHDAGGNLIRITDPDSTTRQFTYDVRHRLTSQTSKRGLVTTYDYNGAGRHARATRPDGLTVGVAPAELVGWVDPAGTLGTAPNPAPVVRPEDGRAMVTDGNGQVTTYAVDGFGQATVITDPLGRTTMTSRDANGQATRVLAPNGAITELTYDAQGNVLTRTEAGGRDCNAKRRLPTTPSSAKSPP